MNKLDRKAIAHETLHILSTSKYEVNGKQINIEQDIRDSVESSTIIDPVTSEIVLNRYKNPNFNIKTVTSVENMSTVDAILKLSVENKSDIGVLNFASAKNPGGGFISGAKAQEEDLAISSSLYATQVNNMEYYWANRRDKSAFYTDYAIYSPNVVFFRNGSLELIETPVKASVLTLPAVNFNLVRKDKESITKAKTIMQRRMALALAIFKSLEARNLILGAYGCGVFKNNPVDIAQNWKDLSVEQFKGTFESVTYAVLDHSKNKACISAFEQILGCLPDGGHPEGMMV